MNKKLMIGLVVIIVILSVVIVSLVADKNKPLATGLNTYCKSDKDCWCRIFTGAGFLPGKSPSRCNLETNRCNPCYYE